MLGVLLIYFIGKSFYDLAELFKKKRWFYAITGVVIYYLGTLIGGLIVGVIIGLTRPELIEELNQIQMGFLTLPFGLLTWAAFYFFLKAYWTNEYGIPKTDYYRD